MSSRATSNEYARSRRVLTAGETIVDADFGNQPVNKVNEPPTIAPIDDVFGLVGEKIVVAPTITDPEGDVFDIS